MTRRIGEVAGRAGEEAAVRRGGEAAARAAGKAAIPRRPSAGRVPASELRGVLEKLLAAGRPSGGRVAVLRRSLFAYASSWRLEELAVGLEDGSRLEILFKDLGREAPGSEAGRVKPSFVRDPRREPWVYRTLLEPHRVGAPVLFGAVAQGRRRRYWLFLEKVAGVPLTEVGDLREWREAARWLAAFHVRFASLAGNPTAGRRSSALPLLRHDARYYARWLRRARHLTASGSSEGARSPARTLDGLAPRYVRAAEALLSLPAVLVHGEFYPSNVLAAEGRERGGVCPVDWEMAALGPPLHDVAALTSGVWPEEERREIAWAYREALPRGTPWRLSPPEFQRALDCCRLQQAIQWLGWAPSWQPPRETATDWLAEAVRCAERVG